MKYRTFGNHTGLRVSELVLGTANFGTRWGYGAPPDESAKILDAFVDAGGNFIDSADSYQSGESEELLGRLLAGRREDVVLATKFTKTSVQGGSPLAAGNSRKAMVSSLEASLRRLQTDRVDVYWVHYADGFTPIDEILRGLDDLARAGKILYAGFSNFPAWRIARGATIAELRGSLPIAGLQIEYSLVQRTGEHDLIPMAQSLGLGTVAWSPLGGGMLTGKYRRGEAGRAQGLGGRVFQPEDTKQRTSILDTVLALAIETGASPSQVAIAWVSSKRVFPIIGPRTREQVGDNIAAVDLVLTRDQIMRLDQASTIPAIFPYSFLNNQEHRQRASGGKLEQMEMPITPVR
ncbi:aryl-alcohol dehydrogenase-like predicted oxidoreductase [Bradyrhizobium sp. USDA 4011]